MTRTTEEVVRLTAKMYEAREALLRRAGILLAKFAPKEPMPAGLPDATVVVTNHNPSAYFAADIYAARALAAQIAAALNTEKNDDR